MKIEYSAAAAKTFRKLDRPVQIKIKKFLDEIETLDNPRNRGKGLTADKAGLWRYRVGDYRLICDIQDEYLIIVVLVVGHRKEVY